jgi:RES domain-containing protein
MNVWRICRSKYESSAFSGLGAEKAGGRWNVKGVSVVYSSENLSLAALELFVHISPECIPSDLIALRASIPDSASVERIDESKLPNDWRNYPAPPSLHTLGTEWILSARTLALIVPSAINPQESNILLNPSHAEFKQLKVDIRQPFHFDPRMFGR